MSTSSNPQEYLQADPLTELKQIELNANPPRAPWILFRQFLVPHGITVISPRPRPD